jgi:hypothetical protein
LGVAVLGAGEVDVALLLPAWLYTFNFIPLPQSSWLSPEQTIEQSLSDTLLVGSTLPQ